MIRHTKTKITPTHENGNAIWLILLTIALFSILGAVISRNSASIDQTGSIESDRIKAAAMLRYAKSIETAVQTMLLNGVSENDLDFVAMAGHDNTNCNTPECEIFNIAGGGVDYQSAQDILDDDSFTGSWHVTTGNRVYQFGCDDSNNGCTELLLIARDLPKSICLQINRIQDITNTGNDAPQQTEVIEGSAYTGSYSTTVNSAFIGGTNAGVESTEVQGKAAGCIFEYSASQDKYHFYQVLISR